MTTSSSTSRPVDRTYASTIQTMRDIVELAQINEPSEIPAELAERLDIDVADVDYVSDTATELADSSVYAVERLAVIESDYTVGELRSVELLLGGGGPTITLTAKMRDGRVSDVWHSWGDSVGNEATVRAQSQADIETVESFLQVLGALLD
jgi:hypothetical protein